MSRAKRWFLQTWGCLERGPRGGPEFRGCLRRNACFHVPLAGIRKMSRACHVPRAGILRMSRSASPWHVLRCDPMARPFARRLARPLERFAARPPGMSPCQLALGQLLCVQEARASDPDQFGQDSDAKEDSIHEAIEHNRGMAHRNSARCSTAQPSAGYIKIDAFRIACARHPTRCL